jgi:hypothetical protein
MNPKSKEGDPKVHATATIWGCVIAMLGVCIPLVAVTNSGVLLPLAVILGASGGTAGLWWASNQSQREEKRLVQTIKRLEERVVNLEAIAIGTSDIPPSLPSPEEAYQVGLMVSGVKKPTLSDFQDRKENT